MSDRDFETDLLVVGSGAGGMTAAFVAAREGLEALLLEKTESYGGSSALSGGGVWVPNNPLMSEAGLHDSLEQARAYLDATVGDRVPAARKQAYLVQAPQMVAYLLRHSHLRFEVDREYPDYYPERPGGMTGGRSLDAVIFRGRRLGPLFDQLRQMESNMSLQLVFTAGEARKLMLFRRKRRYTLVAARVFLRSLWSRISGVKLQCMGRALVAPLRLSLDELGVPLWLNTGVTKLIEEDGRVVGALAEREGRPIRIRARAGVVLAAGGFAHNQEMRERYQPAPIGTEWTSASPGNTGDAIRMGLELGAATDLMEEAWWGPSSLLPDNSPLFLLAERSCPGSIIVDSAGRRFTNESASYIDVVHAMYANNRPDAASIPAHLIVDQRFRDRYPFVSFLPGQQISDESLESGHARCAESLEDLATAIGVDPRGLCETVVRFNDMAASGKDLDFARGASAYDRYYGDPTVEPNPCLGPIEKPPFYSVTVLPGDLGTKGGLLTDEHARVLREDDSPIDGLYAIANTSSTVMGNTYPGPGSTLGPAMAFGYVAALHAHEHAGCK
jgi:3-oxosteroid 1-dehydrogenase